MRSGRTASVLKPADVRRPHYTDSGTARDFADPRREWRRLFCELGTFFLVLVAAGGGVLHREGQISLAAAVVAPGLTVMAIIRSWARSPERT